MVRVAIFFFVHASGITTAVGWTFSHFRLSASLMRAAVNLHVECTARHSGSSRAMMASSRSPSKISACPQRHDFGIFVAANCELR